ncbi:MAG: PLDc N-terminal domain-containing protein [Acidimicrobiia bacterium]
MTIVIASDWHVGQVVYSLLWLSVFVIWFWLVISVFVDVFASHDLTGATKALWVLFVIVLPYLGVFAYLVARGRHMQPVGAWLGLRSPTGRTARERAVLTRRQVDAIAALGAERDEGRITAAEYRTRREQILG